MRLDSGLFGPAHGVAGGLSFMRRKSSNGGGSLARGRRAAGPKPGSAAAIRAQWLAAFAPVASVLAESKWRPHLQFPNPSRCYFRDIMKHMGKCYGQDGHPAYWWPSISQVPVTPVRAWQAWYTGPLRHVSSWGYTGLPFTPSKVQIVGFALRRLTDSPFRPELGYVPATQADSPAILDLRGFAAQCPISVWACLIFTHGDLRYRSVWKCEHYSWP